MTDNDFINFIEFVIICYFIYKVIIFLFFKSNIKRPSYSRISLPKKIQFQQTANNNYNVGSFALDIVTIGGHGRLKEARYNYEKAYGQYAFHFNKSIDERANINDKLNQLGSLTYNLMTEIEKSQTLLSRPAKKGLSKQIANQFNHNANNLHRLQNIASEKSSTGGALLQGGVVGGLAAVGTWTFVASFGTASTGTAIATLSGAAAHNAILAYIGGGTLAAGGGGIAGGTAMLGAIVAVPIILFSSYKTHKSATELNDKIVDIENQTSKVVEGNQQLYDLNSAINERINYLAYKHKKMCEINKEVEKLIYPHGIFSKTRRTIKEVFNQDFYTREEAEGIDRLLQAIDDVSQDIMNNNIQTPLISYSNSNHKLEKVRPRST